MRQPHGRQTDAVVPAIFGVTRQGIRKSGRFRPAGRGLLPGFFCPLRLRGQYQPEVTPGTIRHAGDFAAEFTGGFAVEAQPVFPANVKAGEYTGALTFVVTYQ